MVQLLRNPAPLHTGIRDRQSDRASAQRAHVKETTASRAPITDYETNHHPPYGHPLPKEGLNAFAFFAEVGGQRPDDAQHQREARFRL